MDEAAYEEAKRRLREQRRNPGSEIPLTPYGQMTSAATMSGAPEPSIGDRIASLCADVAEAGRALEIARHQHQDVAAGLKHAESRFVDLSDQLTHLLRSHHDVPKDVMGR